MNEAVNAADPKGKSLIKEYGVMDSDRKLWGSSEQSMGSDQLDLTIQISNQ